MNRWTILAVLVAVRTVMAMQYQAIGALSPFLIDAFEIGLAEIGVLIGLYLLPGLVFAIPGSAIGQYFGEKPMVIFATGLMAAGALLMATTANYHLFQAGHLLAGLGGVLVNVLTTKMVADWFVGREITTALAIFINSWPLGIALALVIFPPLASATDASLVFAVLALMSFLAGLAIALLYRPPPDETKTVGVKAWPQGKTLIAVLFAGLCWGAFNGGLGILFGFGTPLLVSLGETPEAAARATSLILWVLAIAAPCGGLLADRTGRGSEMIFLGLVGLAILSPIALQMSLTMPVFLAYGIVSGLVAGPIMSLPARSLAPEHRVVGMGIFFTVYYAIFIVSPALAGALSDVTGWLGTAFFVAMALQVVALIGMILHKRAVRAA